MKRQILAAVTSATMVAAILAGCGGASSSSASAASSGSNSASSEQTASESATSASTSSSVQSTSDSEAVASTSGADVQADKQYTIGFAQCTLASPFYTQMKTVIEDYAKEKGVTVTVVSADDDVTKQNSDIMDLISKGIDALILNPINTEGVQTGIDACKDAGIPVITVDRMAASGATAAVVRDNKKMGQIVGEELLKELGGADKASGTILELQGTSGDQVMMDRRDGFEAAFADAPNVKIVQSAYCDYTRSKAVTAAQDMIQANSDIIAIYGHNDDMALGGLQAAQEAGLTDVKVCGVDGLMEAVKAINDGTYACTALNDPGTEIKVALDTAIKVLNGESVEESVDAGTGLVNADNAADYVDDSLPFAEIK